ncbi:MAG: energy-coupling factor ABC transporter permease [Verrucomicrobiia bacterium]|jgi:cobalt/nickel transport system permease protein
MHIPDGFLDAKTAAATAVLSAAGLGVALRQTRISLPAQRVPLMGLAAAFVFAAQMINFPVLGGTSGHLVGATLAAVLLGPSAAVIVLTAVLVVQCFLFADGGVTTLGANIFNMAIVGSITGYAVYRGVRRLFAGLRGTVLAAAFAAWCSTVVAAVSCAGQLAWSGTLRWPVAFPAMANVHMLIGLGEGAITALVITAIARVRPELLESCRGWTRPGVAGERWPRSERGWGELVVYGTLIALGLALFVAPFACPWPDGLDKVAQAFGFAERAASRHGGMPAPLPDYRIPGIGSASVATALAGAIGTVVVFGLAFVLARVLVPKPNVGAASAPR